MEKRFWNCCQFIYRKLCLSYMTIRDATGAVLCHYEVWKAVVAASPLAASIMSNFGYSQKLLPIQRSLHGGKSLAIQGLGLRALTGSRPSRSKGRHESYLGGELDLGFHQLYLWALQRALQQCKRCWRCYQSDSTSSWILRRRKWTYNIPPANA